MPENSYLRFGIFDHIDHAGGDVGHQLQQRLQLGVACEQAGFHAYHVAEHHSTPLGLSPSPLLFLTALASRTQTLRLGPLVLPLPFYHPLRVYEEVCMLDQLSDGRLELGVGKGISPHELAVYGLDPATAADRYAEFLECLHLAFRSDTLDYSGQYVTAEAVPLPVKPRQRPHPPLWYGVLTPDTAARAAAQDMNIVCGAGQVSDIANAIASYRDAYRGDRQPLLGMMRQLVVGETDAQALSIARRAYGVFRQNFDYLWQLHDDPMAGQLLPPTWDELSERGEALAGSAETVADRLAAELAECGANYLVCRFAFGDLSLEEMEASVSRFAESVMPRLQREAQQRAEAA